MNPSSIDKLNISFIDQEKYTLFHCENFYYLCDYVKQVVPKLTTIRHGKPITVMVSAQPIQPGANDLLITDVYSIRKNKINLAPYKHVFVLDTVAMFEERFKNHRIYLEAEHLDDEIEFKSKIYIDPPVHQYYDSAPIW